VIQQKRGKLLNLQFYNKHFKQVRQQFKIEEIRMQVIHVLMMLGKQILSLIFNFTAGDLAMLLLGMLGDARV
jgi:hypothetical protein